MMTDQEYLKAKVYNLQSAALKMAMVGALFQMQELESQIEACKTQLKELEHKDLTKDIYVRLSTVVVKGNEVSNWCQELEDFVLTTLKTYREWATFILQGQPFETSEYLFDKLNDNKFGAVFIRVL